MRRRSPLIIGGVVELLGGIGAGVAGVIMALTACSAHRDTPEDIAERGWDATELVVAAGEGAPTCSAAGVAMQRTFTDHRAAFVDAMELERDPDRLAAASEFIAANGQRYADLDLRMEALADRCSDDATVRAAFHLLESP